MPRALNFLFFFCLYYKSFYQNEYSLFSFRQTFIKKPNNFAVDRSQQRITQIIIYNLTRLIEVYIIREKVNRLPKMEHVTSELSPCIDSAIHISFFFLFFF